MRKRKEIEWEVDKNDCWNCTSHSRNTQGYPLMRLDGVGPKTPISRIMYTKYHGEIPKGKVIRHKCDNPHCINPDHLEIGTQFDNIQDMIKRGRSRYTGSKGEKNGRAKLTEQSVRQIFEKRKAGASEKELSKEFGVHKSMISAILRRKIWVYVAISVT